MSSISELEGRKALEQIANANREMADRVKPPGWYNWSLSLGLGGLAAVQEAPLPVIFGYEVVFLGVVAVLVSAYRRKSGIWLPGYRSGRTRWVALGGAAAYAAVFLGGVFLYREMNIRGACVAAGLIVATLARFQCHFWQKAYRRDLGVA